MITMSDENRHRITQDYFRQNNVVVKDKASHLTERPPVDQVLHILGQPGRVWCGILAPRTLHALAVMLHGEMRLIS